MGTALTALSSEQKEVFNSMPKAWQSKAARAIKLRSEGRERDVWEAYELGEIVAAFTENERNYGEAAVPNLSLVMDEREGFLWGCRQFVGTYTKEAVQRLLAKSLRGGKQMSFSHFDKLSGVEGKNAGKVRKELENAIIAEHLSVDELAKRIQRKLGTKRSSGGRAPLKPKSINSGISQMVEASTKYENRFNGWQEVVFTGIAKAGSDQISADLVRHLEEGKKSQEQLKVKTEAAIVEFDKAIDRAKSMLSKQKQETASGEEATTKKLRSGGTAKKKVKKKVAATNGEAPRKKKKKKVLEANGEVPRKKKVKKKKSTATKRSVAERIATAKKKKRRPVPA